MTHCMLNVRGCADGTETGGGGGGGGRHWPEAILLLFLINSQ